MKHRIAKRNLYFLISYLNKRLIKEYQAFYRTEKYCITHVVDCNFYHQIFENRELLAKNQYNSFVLTQRNLIFCLKFKETLTNQMTPFIVRGVWGAKPPSDVDEKKS